MTTVEEHIPIVHSLAIWKMCEALDLKVKLVLLPVPVVGSFSVWKICQALDLPATYDPQIIKTAVFRKPNKAVPVVHSTAIFELCKALDLKAKLAPHNKIHVYYRTMSYNNRSCDASDFLAL
ncbi:hypothetical protein TNCT_282621 [Trichonephila clavata]|uniref:Uncharacterized protein n=1 Tax=Trichonephila clavata TaxID=2740835 RepID=A0A8X6F5A6_TRICU|nr:hypothetical protein TNCT_282621 [Trichonephila clavata]